MTSIIQIHYYQQALPDTDPGKSRGGGILFSFNLVDPEIIFIKKYY